MIRGSHDSGAASLRGLKAGGRLRRLVIVAIVAVMVTSTVVGFVTPVAAAVEGDPVVVEPSEEWTTLLGGTRVDSVAEASNGDYLTAQYAGTGAVRVIRLDSTGAPVADWPKTYTVNVTTNTGTHQIIPTADGGYAVAGTSPFYVLKLDSAGNREWLYEGVDRQVVYDFIQTSDGGFVAVGDTTSNQAMYATKVDSSGSFVWTQTASDLNAPSARGVVEAEGAYAVVGKVNTQNNRNPFFMRLDPATGDRIPFSDSSLTRIYTDYSGGSFGPLVYDGNRYVAGGFAPFFGGNAILVELTTDGVDTQLGRYTGGTLFADVKQTPTGFVLAGYDFPSSRAWVVKTDETGTVLWDKYFANTGSASGYLVGAEVDQTADGGYVLAGFVVSGGTTVNPFLTRLGPDLDVVDVTVSTPTDGALLDTATVTLAGTATSTLGTLSPVDVSVGGSVVGTASMASIASDGSWTFVYTVPADGPYTFTASATDNLGASDTESLSVTVDTTAPTFDSASASPSPVAGGDTVTVTAQVSDATTGVSSVDAQVTGGSSLTLVALTETTPGVWSGTFTAPLSSETLTVDITAEDAAGNANSTTRTVTVDSTPPTVSAVDVTPDVVTPGSPVDVAATVTDTSGVAEVTANGVALSDTDGDGVWNGSLTAPPGDGPVTVEVNATDALGNIATDTSASYVVDGSGPVLTLSVPPTSTTASVTVSGSATDTNGIASAALLVDGTSVSGFELEPDGTFTETLTLAAGVSTITLNATDTLGNSAETSETVDVDVNDPPVADAGADQTADEFSTVELNATESFDPDGDPLTYLWTQTAGPVVTLSGDDTATPTFTAPGVDTPNTLTLAFEVNVSDGTTWDTDDVTVTVEPVVYDVAIDVDPTDVDNNVTTKGVIRVVLYGDENVPASDVVVENLRFGNETTVDDGGGATPGNGVPTRDVDGDGRDDIVLLFRADATGLVPGDSLAVLVGDLADGTELRGEDPVTVEVPGGR